jgi:plastocyanin
MKKLLATGAALAFLGAGCMSSSSPTPTPVQPQSEVPEAAVPAAPTKPTPTANTNQKKPAATIEINDGAFAPKQLAIQAGDTVVWVNKGKNDHTVKGLESVLLWDSGNLKPGETFNHTFTEPGVYKYTCGIHPNMTGEVIVGKVQAQ